MPKTNKPFSKETKKKAATKKPASKSKSKTYSK